MTQDFPNPHSKEAVAYRLRLARAALGLSQAEFCRRTGIATNTWNNYEKGLNRISLEEAFKVVNATGISLDYIYRGVEALLPSQIADNMRKIRLEQDEERKSA